MITVREIIKQSGIKFTRLDGIKIGHEVAKTAIGQGVSWEKKVQKEGGKKYTVNAYPDTFITTIEECIIQYFTTKAKENESTDKTPAGS